MAVPLLLLMLVVVLMVMVVGMGHKMLSGHATKIAKNVQRFFRLDRAKYFWPKIVAIGSC